MEMTKVPGNITIIIIYSSLCICAKSFFFPSKYLHYNLATTLAGSQQKGSQKGLWNRNYIRVTDLDSKQTGLSQNMAPTPDRQAPDN